MIAKESRKQAAFRVIGCVAFVVLCVWMLVVPTRQNLSPDDASKVTAISWVGTAFFSALGLRYLWTLLRPGKLTISPTGITQELGWRTRHWGWDDIDQIDLRRTAANLVSVCMLYPKDAAPVRLFGWDVSAEQIFNAIENARAQHSKGR